MSLQIAQERSLKNSAAAHDKNKKGSLSTARYAGGTAIAGTVVMLFGAVLWGTSGTDLWSALESGDMAGYLTAVGPVKGQLVVNLSLWIFGVLILGLAGRLMSIMSTRRRPLGQAALVCYQTAVPLVIVAYIAMLALVVQLGGDTSATSVAIAQTVGWIGARADDLATVLILGFGPLAIALAGQGEWVPTWLLRWGFVTGLTGLLSITFLYLPGMTSYSFIILPVGMGWTLAAGIVCLKYATATD